MEAIRLVRTGPYSDKYLAEQTAQLFDITIKAMSEKDMSGEYYHKPEADALFSKWQSAMDEAKEETAKDRAAIADMAHEIASLEKQADEIYCDMNEILSEYRQKIDRLRLWKESVEEQHNRVMAEKCASDEIHCTCVPVLRAEVARKNKALAAVIDLIEQSQGVYGLHLNGDGAPWETLRTGGQFEQWLIDFDEALSGGR